MKTKSVGEVAKMPRQTKYNNFVLSDPFHALDKKSQGNGSTRVYISIMCPYCKETFTRITQESIKCKRAAECKAHLAKCHVYNGKSLDKGPFSTKQQKGDTRLTVYNDPPSPTDVAEDEARDCTEEPLITIYKVIYVPEDRAVYTGRTRDPERRLKQHRSASSKCRLLRNAIRKFGIRKHVIEPIVRCRASDADVNESHYIMANKTLYPSGYNLRHGSKAGHVDDGEHSLIPMRRTIPIGNMADELKAISEATNDVREMFEEGESDEDLLEIAR